MKPTKQLRTSSNLRNHATLQDGRVTMQQVQGRQVQSYVGTRNKGNATSSRANNVGGQARVVKCYNCQGEGHMGRQCTQPKRPRNVAWFKEKAMLAEAHESGQILDEEQLAFLADPGITDCHDVQPTIIHNAAFQTDDLDAYDSDCDDISSAKAVLMVNLSNYDSDVLSEVLNFETYQNDMDNQSVQAMQHFKQTLVDNYLDNEITSDSNTIPYSQYLQETQQAAVQDTNSFVQQDLMILSVIEQMQHDVIPVIDEEETLILEKCSVDKHYFEIHKKELFLDNDRLLHQIISQDVMLCVMNVNAIFRDSMNLEMKKSKSCNKCLDLEAELVKKKIMV
ncbi:gag-pol polyprotein [Tanacetum coccineum]|uniref:Gag-pol polyprotein n=1 Tax=Tanacetum coccineum TaxID=301880 RepID=A0ABQ5CVX7_9ASTR